MKASKLLELAAQPKAWRRQARAMRFCAEAALGPGAARLLDTLFDDVTDGGPDGEAVMDGVRLLYGYALEAGLKAWLIERDPAVLQFEVTVDGTGDVTRAKIASIAGKPNHDLLSLADAAGLFKDAAFAGAVQADERDLVRRTCMDLGEAVVWRARYPTPLISPDSRAGGGAKRALDDDQLNEDFGGFRLYPNNLRKLLDPILDLLLTEPSDMPSGSGVGDEQEPSR